jgi:hypothetical protein
MSGSIYLPQPDRIKEDPIGGVSEGFEGEFAVALKGDLFVIDGLPFSIHGDPHLALLKLEGYIDPFVDVDIRCIAVEGFPIVQLDGITVFFEHHSIDVMTDVELWPAGGEGGSFEFDTQVKDELSRQLVESNDRGHAEVMIPVQSLHRLLGVFVIGFAEKDAILHLPGLGRGLPTLLVEGLVKVVLLNESPFLKQMRLEGQRIGGPEI